MPPPLVEIGLTDLPKSGGGKVIFSKLSRTAEGRNSVKLCRF